MVHSQVCRTCSLAASMCCVLMSGIRNEGLRDGDLETWEWKHRYPESKHYAINYTYFNGMGM